MDFLITNRLPLPGAAKGYAIFLALFAVVGHEECFDLLDHERERVASRRAAPLTLYLARGFRLCRANGGMGDMRIGEAATAAGVNIQTLRYYEVRGLLPEPRRRAGGYRDYEPDDVRRVRFIKRAQEVGF